MAPCVATVCSGTVAGLSPGFGIRRDRAEYVSQGGSFLWGFGAVIRACAAVGRYEEQQRLSAAPAGAWAAPGGAAGRCITMHHLALNMPRWVGVVPYSHLTNASWGYPTDCSGALQMTHIIISYIIYNIIYYNNMHSMQCSIWAACVVWGAPMPRMVGHKS
jgi:hypothetical protein